jgi:hypothetical protein
VVLFDFELITAVSVSMTRLAWHAARIGPILYVGPKMLLGESLILHTGFRRIETANYNGRQTLKKNRRGFKGKDIGWNCSGHLRVATERLIELGHSA